MSSQPSAPATFDPGQLRAFLDATLVPMVAAGLGCMEMRLWGARFNWKSGFIEPATMTSGNMSGWYDRADSLIVDAQRLKDVSAYVTVNPVSNDLLALSYNTIAKAKTSTADDDISVLLNLFLDCDPKRKSGISSTDAELAAALARRDQILDDFPELRAASLWGSSGNGGLIYARTIGYPNDPEHRQLVARVVDGFSLRYSDRTVEVDQKTKNPARVMALPGTRKCKGSHMPVRPHRMVALEWPGFPGSAGSPGYPGDPGDPGLAPQYGVDGAAAVRVLEPIDLRAIVDRLPDPGAGRRATVAMPAGLGLGTRPGTGQGSGPGNAAAPQYGNHGSQGSHGNHSNGRPIPPGQGEYDPAWALYHCRKLIFDSRFGRSVEGSNGHKDLLHAALTISSDFGLNDAVGFALFEEWNRTMADPPEDDKQVQHKWDQARKKRPEPELGEYWKIGRGDHRRDRNGYEGDRHDPGAAWGTEGENNKGGQDKDLGDDCLPGTETNPHRLARLVIARRFSHLNRIALRFWREDFHHWNGSHYYRMPQKEVAAQINGVLEEEAERIHQIALMRRGMRRQADKDSGGGDQQQEKLIAPFRVTTRLVSDVAQAMASVALLKEKDCPNQPAWLSEGWDWPADEVLPTRNALIHLPTYADGNGGIEQPTPSFFSPFAVGYDFNPVASSPTNWLKFLGDIPLNAGDEIQYQLWPNDKESIETLQEWMGHLLTPDTSQQKIMMLIGPKRSGKGTIIRVLRSLIGTDNVVNPTLSQLGTNFGMAPLIGKHAAIITDARISGRTDTAMIVEQLLAISGEDARTIDRKHREAVTLKLPTRFMLVSNELPRVRDMSGALAGRIIFLKLMETFYGREDTALIEKLLPELPGILRWAIEGWKRLRDRGYFVQPSASRDLAQAMEDLASPVKAFVRECCKLGQPDEFQVACTDLFNSWTWWAQSKGQENVGIEEEFGRNLRAVLPHTVRKRPRIDGKRVWVYAGIRILEDGEENKNEQDEDE